MRIFRVKHTTSISIPVISKQGVQNVVKFGDNTVACANANVSWMRVAFYAFRRKLVRDS